jgi:hypothetical protein
MESPPPPRRTFTTLALMLPFFAMVPIILLLASLSNTSHGWAPVFMRLSTSTLFLHELLRSAGLSSVTVRSCQLMRLIEPKQLYFFSYNHVRLCLALEMVFIWMGFLIYGNKNELDDCKGFESSANPDMVGSGVRLSMYILFFAVFASLFVGSFHSGPSGTKELGIATLISTYRSAGTFKAHLATAY